MALFRIAAAAGLLLALAPDQTIRALRDVVGAADAARSAPAHAEPGAETLVAHCRAQPRACAVIAREVIAGEGGTPLRSSKP